MSGRRSAVKIMLFGRALELPPLREGDTGHVYVAGFRDYVKIGWSETVAGRLYEVQAGIPELLVLYSLIPARANAEKALHRRFPRQRLHGEWFRLAGGLKRWIDGSRAVVLTGVANRVTIDDRAGEPLIGNPLHF